MAKVLAMVCLLGTAWAKRESDPYFVPSDSCCESLCSKKPGCYPKCKKNAKDVHQTINLHVCTRGICSGLSNRDKAEMDEAKLSDEELQSLGDSAENAFPFADDVSLVEAQHLQDELASMLQYKTDSNAIETKGCSYPCDFCGELCTALGEGFLLHRLCKWKCMWNIQAFRTDKDTYCKICGQFDYMCKENEEPQGGKGCEPCKRGRSSHGSKCEKCVPGRFGDGNGCKECAKGEFQPTEGKDECEHCTENQYVNADRTECKPCPNGEIVNGDKKGCTACTAGRYQKGTECNECGKGLYQKHQGQTQCQNCSKGEWTNKGGATKCVKCLSKKTYGMYTGLAHDACDTCELHKQPLANLSGCEDCPEGKDGHVHPGRCDECAEGTFSDKKGEACIQCPKNTEQNDAATGCKNCTAGYFRGTGTKCQKCWAGYWCPGEQVGPVKCKDGQGTPATLPLGLGSEKGSKTEEDCRNCSAGSYSENVDAEGEKTQSCVLCKEGKYQDSAAANECKMCGPGKWTSGKGKTAMADCTEENCMHHSCASCNDGFIKKDGRCQRCIKGCKKCPELWTEQECETCMDKFRKEGKKCKLCEVKHCKKCTKDGCTTCDDNYEGNATSCTKKPETTEAPTKTVAEKK